VDLLEQSVMMSDIAYVFMGFVAVIDHVQLSLLIMGGPHWCIDNYRLFNYLSDFAGNWLIGVYVCHL